MKCRKYIYTSQIKRGRKGQYRMNFLNMLAKFPSKFYGNVNILVSVKIVIKAAIMYKAATLS